MMVVRIRKGRYVAHGTRIKDDTGSSARIIIEYDPETHMWYAYDYFSGQSVCDSERTLREIKERLS